MALIKSLLDFLKIKGTSEEKPAPQGYCPNCWGREEYGGHFYQAIKQENLDVNSNDSNVGWVSAYANKHLSGIALKRHGESDDKLICENCKVSYAEEPEQSDS